MESERRKSFTFIWKLENASYCEWGEGVWIKSPSFTVDEMHETIWKVHLYFPQRRDNAEFCLERQPDNKSPESVEIDCELAFLPSGGEALRAYKENNAEVGQNERIRITAWLDEVFLERGSVFLPQDTLTIRCRMWKSVGEMSKDVQCFARSRIAVEKRSFIWSIENFSSLERREGISYEINSQDFDDEFMTLVLIITGGRFSEEKLLLKITPNYRIVKKCTFQLSIVDASKNAAKCFQEEFCGFVAGGSKYFTLFCSRKELLENKSSYLPNNVLSLSCECTFSSGTVREEIENIVSDCIALEKMNSHNHDLDKGSEVGISKCVLMDNLKSMLNNSSLSDVKLKTKSETYPAHKFILGARSPVFKAMFSNDMKEKMKECVDIEDLSDDTVLRMLRYSYCAEVEELEWTSATELYEAADKYEILTLKDVCSSYLKSNLCRNNACEALILADLHQDCDLKGFVQDFILRHGEDIINSKEWDQLVETNIKLAYETISRKFKK